MRPFAFGKWWGDLRKLTDGAKNPSKSPLAHQPVPQKLDPMPLSKGPFSANIHPIIPKLSLPIPQSMCFRQMVGDLFENETLWGQKSTSNHRRTPAGFLQTRLKFTFQRSFLHEYASDHSELCCAYNSVLVLSK